jgi:hypothetical protein
VIKCDTSSSKLFLHAPAFILFFFWLCLEFLGNTTRPLFYLLYTGSRPPFTWGDKQEPGTKRKNCTLHLVAFAVSSFCWFSVVVQSSGWLLAEPVALHFLLCSCTFISIAHHISTSTFILNTHHSARVSLTGSLIEMMAPRDARDLYSLPRRFEICELLLLLRCFALRKYHT